MTDLAQYVADLDFEALTLKADILGVLHHEEDWLGDEWSNKENALRVEVLFALYGKLAQFIGDTE